MDQQTAVLAAGLAVYLLLVVIVAIWYFRGYKRVRRRGAGDLPVAISETDLRKLGITPLSRATTPLLAPLLGDEDEEDCQTPTLNVSRHVTAEQHDGSSEDGLGMLQHSSSSRPLLQPLDSVTAERHDGSSDDDKPLLQPLDSVTLVGSPPAIRTQASVASQASTSMTSRSQPSHTPSVVWHQQIVDKYATINPGELSPAHKEILDMFRRSVEHRSRRGATVCSAPPSPTAAAATAGVAEGGEVQP